MRDLLAADWYRVRKSGLFTAMILCVLAVAALMTAVALPAGMRMEQARISEPNLLVFGLIAGAACAILCGYTEETGYREGVVRNQLIAGHTRSRVYWSSFLICTLCGLILAAAYFVPSYIVESIVLGPVNDAPLFWQNFVSGLCTIPAFVALYILIGAIVGGKGTGLACMVVYVALITCSFVLMELLAAPEFVPRYWIEDGVYIGDGMESELVPNPGYLASPGRDVARFFASFLPTGAALSSMVLEGAGLGIYSLAFCVLCWIIGLCVMRRRNIN